ncbi:MAG: AtpZ/AtpI family protein [Chitinophagaceae bacterium]|nr:AtpZ/AtpI family protein [Rubrivivax sp.]
MSKQDGFDKRLQDARTRQGLDRATDSKAGLPGGSWGLGFRAGVEIVSALVVGVVLGLLADRWLGTWPWLFLLFFVLGSVAGIMNVFRLFKPRPTDRA